MRILCRKKTHKGDGREDKGDDFSRKCSSVQSDVFQTGGTRKADRYGADDNVRSPCR